MWCSWKWDYDLLRNLIRGSTRTFTTGGIMQVADEPKFGFSNWWGYCKPYPLSDDRTLSVDGIKSIISVKKYSDRNSLDQLFLKIQQLNIWYSFPFNSTEYTRLLLLRRSERNRCLPPTSGQIVYCFNSLNPDQFKFSFQNGKSCFDQDLFPSFTIMIYLLPSIQKRGLITKKWAQRGPKIGTASVEFI